VEPTTALLLLSLLTGVGAVGYVGATARPRPYRATRGVTGAVRAGWTSGRGRAGTVFSRPPARPASGTTFGTDVGWGLRQLLGALRVGASFLGGVRHGYHPAADAASARFAARSDRVRARLSRLRHPTMPAWLTAVAAADERLRAAVRRRLVPGLDAPADATRHDDPTAPAAVANTDTTEPAPAGQNGATVTAAPEIPSLSVVTEFTSPGQMEEPLGELTALAEQIVNGLIALADGLNDFVNGYAEAGFTTDGLTDAIAGLVETVDDEGHVVPLSFLEHVAPVVEAIAEAKTLGEVGSQLGAEGDVEAFKED
jgi:hypothetical protein